ncbi:MAG: sulfoxide reductase heme-binding subunit YedZ [Anaerolineae bacterium]|nr:sulfoxide reductase heme-binding subunit YedZ [Anaerolineae bacterium]
MRSQKTLWLKIAVHAAAWVPFVVLAWGYWRGGLGPDPTGEVIRRTGRVAIVLLILSLVPTAVKLLTGSGALIKVRRILGLYAFMYAALHLLGFAWLDYGFDLRFLLPALVDGRRALAGLIALVVLLLLAITSTGGWIRRLGKNWKRLHRLTYLASVLAVLHYAWSFKELRAAPVVAGAALLPLLVARVPPVAGLLARWRRR